VREYVTAIRKLHGLQPDY